MNCSSLHIYCILLTYYIYSYEAILSSPLKFGSQIVQTQAKKPDLLLYSTNAWFTQIKHDCEC